MESPAGEGYQPLSPKLMLLLAAPHTWVASVVPVMLALVLALLPAGCGGLLPCPVAGGLGGGTLDIFMLVLLLAISVLFQSAVNTINDYFDWKKGTDTLRDSPDPSDAVLLYWKVNPKQVLAFAALLLLAAFALGAYVVARAGFIPFFIACIGAAVVYLYSGGRTPISYLPIGEAVSGTTMGGLITLACYTALCGQCNLWVLLFSLPLILGIALIMCTNNCCDIEKDIAAGRRTLPVLLGRARALALYRALMRLWLLSIWLLVGIFFTPGLLLLPFMQLMVHPIAAQLSGNPFNRESRPAAFAACTSLNVALAAFYCMALLAAGLLHVLAPGYLPFAL